VTHGTVATSQPTATRAGLRALELGGNAVDAAIAAAAVLCVTEPMSTGIGGDAFAIVWRDGAAHGLDAAGPAPLHAEPLVPVEQTGPRSVTVPGAVAGWAALAERHGRLGLDVLLADAIECAEQGFEVQPMCAVGWQASGFGEPPRAGERRDAPEVARTLRAIAEDGPDAFYRGRVAEQIAQASWLDEDDLARYEPHWVEPLRVDYRGVEVLELPPPTQGVVALEALGLLALGEPTMEERVECVRLALEDGLARVRDGADVRDLLAPDYLRARRAERALAREPRGGTVYLCAVDEDGAACSFIQSLYEGFGSKVVAGDTGVVLQNRGACFAVSGAVEPGRRPYHTIIPGLLLRDGELWGPFGSMGGFIQAQSHVQIVAHLVDDGMTPQQALDAPRFRVDGETLRVEAGLEGLAGATPTDDVLMFGGGQIVLRDGDRHVAGSDRRKDGFAGTA
jgi:gamma-glutamyltranspeptidase/glutathione hydrolase